MSNINGIVSNLSMSDSTQAAIVIQSRELKLFHPESESSSNSSAIFAKAVRSLGQSQASVLQQTNQTR